MKFSTHNAVTSVGRGGKRIKKYEFTEQQYFQLYFSVFVETVSCVERAYLHDPCFVYKLIKIGQWLHHRSFYATDHSSVYRYVHFEIRDANQIILGISHTHTNHSATVTCMYLHCMKQSLLSEASNRSARQEMRRFFAIFTRNR